MDNRALVASGLAGITEACEFLALSRSKLYELMDAGQLPFVKIGRARRIPRQCLIELAATNVRSS